LTRGPSGLAKLRQGGKLALARAFAALESDPRSEATLALLDEAWEASHAHVVGLTGPPGVGKSTLLSALVKALRGRGRTVGIIAVDPSSRRSGGALLGDRTRLELDAEDAGVFARSMAARDRLGGLAELSAGGTVLLRAVFDVVLVETVGVGQSETAVRDLADTVVLAAQPGSGDALQFMKAGVSEIPDVAVVTKADLGEPVRKAARDLEAALRLARARSGWHPPVLAVSGVSGEGLDPLLEALDRHRGWLADSNSLATNRRRQAQAWLEQAVLETYGKSGLALALPVLHEAAEAGGSPFRRIAETLGRLELRWR
jgi:LAO/AO transport system kinase